MHITKHQRVVCSKRFQLLTHGIHDEPEQMQGDIVDKLPPQFVPALYIVQNICMINYGRGY
jgi:hypothetical protein